jgi:hypothetical protein
MGVRPQSGIVFVAGGFRRPGMGSGAMMMPGEKPGGFQRAVRPLLSVLKLFGADVLEQNEWERDSLLTTENGADGLTWASTRAPHRFFRNKLVEDA